MFKIINDESCPAYLKKLLPANTSRRSARLATYERPTCGNFHDKFFIPKTLSEWNKLTPYIRNSPTLSTFKSRYHAKFDKYRNQTIETISPRKHEILINRFRAGFTELHQDLFRHNFKDVSAICDCGEGPESHFHFFFKCKNFSNLRTKFLHNIRPLLKVPIPSIMRPQTKAIRLILLGDDDKLLDPANRQKVIKHTLNYILATNRFNTY